MNLEKLIEKHTINETAKILKSSYSTVSRRLKKLGVSKREASKTKKLNEIKDLLEHGFTVAQVAKMINKHRSYIYYYKNIVDKDCVVSKV